MKYRFLFFLLSVALITGCKENSGNNHDDTTGKTSTKEHAGEHIYSCPMHPEVNANKPGKCSKCGMDLVHTDKATDNKKYKIDFRSKPAVIESAKQAELFFTPRIENDNNTLVPLDLVHEKKMHLIIVSKDLSYFDHVHPEYNTDGSYQVTALAGGKEYSKGEGNNETRFPFGGEYITFQDYMPSGSQHQLSRIPVTVKGPEKKAVKYSAEQLSWSGNDYKVNLTFDKNVSAGQDLELTATVNHQGKAVTNLQNYLGALGHMVIISEDTEQYLHVHPLESEEKGPQIKFHSNFSKPGIYRVFLQFKHENKIRTADFVIIVK